MGTWTLRVGFKGFLEGALSGSLNAELCQRVLGIVIGDKSVPNHSSNSECRNPTFYYIFYRHFIPFGVQGLGEKASLASLARRSACRRTDFRAYGLGITTPRATMRGVGGVGVRVAAAGFCRLCSMSSGLIL